MNLLYLDQKWQQTKANTFKKYQIARNLRNVVWKIEDLEDIGFTDGEIEHIHTKITPYLKANAPKAASEAFKKLEKMVFSRRYERGN